jgi:histidinol-phosphate/aromatic aminotransferase/cobyric acid decarboxylase-like protein
MKIKLALAEGEALDVVKSARYDVYATELGQYEPRTDRELSDASDVESTFITATVNGALVGFVGITPPSSPRLSLEKYIHRDAVPFPFDRHLFEVRTLTVLPSFRGSIIAGVLMYAAFRWVESHGGTRIIAIGRRDVLDMYLELGLELVGLSFNGRAVQYDLLSATVASVRKKLKRYDSRLRRMEDTVDWQLGIAFRPPAECYHGGAFFDAIGDEFDDLGRSNEVINADVLDAWFPPSPAVTATLAKHMDWIVRTSPPTHAQGLMRTIGRVRGVDPDCILPGGGSSALIFLALRQWLRPSSRVLLLDPTYGEYAHVLQNIIRCHVERFPLCRDEGYEINLARLARKLREHYDLFIWVNPNNPTGRHVPRSVAEELLRRVPRRTRVWVDETYVDYVGHGQSLESMAATSENIVVCKSLSKACALSGLRAGYLCAAPHILEELRALSPPWSVSLAAQIAATRALQDRDYYRARYAETAELRRQLTTALTGMGISEIIPGCANFLLFHLPFGSPDTTAVVRACRMRSLFLRDVSNMGSTMGRHAVRIAVKDSATNLRIASILRDVLGDTGAVRQRMERSSADESKAHPVVV